MALSPQVKNTFIIAGVATLTVVGVLFITGRVLGPRASAPRSGVQAVTGPNRKRQ